MYIIIYISIYSVYILLYSCIIVWFSLYYIFIFLEVGILERNLWATFFFRIAGSLGFVGIQAMVHRQFVRTSLLRTFADGMPLTLGTLGAGGEEAPGVPVAMLAMLAVLAPVSIKKIMGQRPEECFFR